MRTELAVGALLFGMLPLRALGTLWPVLAGGSPITPNNLPYYSPQLLTIEIGDQVRWSNQGGIHNVNGGTSTFPGNPQGFYSGLPDGGPWSWSFTFTIPGVYNYHCDGDGHAATQFGTITVVDPSTGLAQFRTASQEVRLHPVPVRDLLTVEFGGLQAQAISIINLAGEVVGSERIAQERFRALDVSALKPANYFLIITERNGRVVARPFTKL